MSDKVYTVRVTVELLTDGEPDQKTVFEEVTRGEALVGQHVLKGFETAKGVTRGIERAMQNCAEVAGFATNPEDAKALLGTGR